MARLPDILTCEGLELRRWDTAFTEPMISAIQKSFAELQQWMSWAQKMPTADELRQVLLQGQTAFDANRAWEYAIFETEADCTRRIARIVSRSATGSILIGPAEVSQQLRPVP